MLITEKKYHFETSDGKKLHPYIREFFTAESQTVFTWPCAILLASYIAAVNVIGDLRTLELGAGCGLPSIVAALCGARSCVLTEREGEPLVLKNLEINIAKNDLCHICSVIPLDWKSLVAPVLPDIDVILGADLFYSSEDFEFIISLVDKFMTRNREVVFYTTYQERSTRRSIAPYLEKYSMVAEVVPLESFLHISHRSDGVCNIAETITVEDTDGHCDSSSSSGSQSHEKGEKTVKIVRPVKLPTFDSLLLLKITKKCKTQNN